MKIEGKVFFTALKKYLRIVIIPVSRKKH